jgi:hypothetical protein
MNERSIKPKIVKRLEENIGKKFHYISVEILLERTPEAQAAKQKQTNQIAPN